MALVLDRVAPAVEVVSDEDVQYTLDMCREVNRIYQTYQDGCIEASSVLMSGMVMTRDMLTAMRAKVTAGMPAMRIAVAAAQTEEIIAVLYGQAAVVSLDPATEVRLRRRHRSAIAASVEGMAELPPAAGLEVAVVPAVAANPGRPDAPAHRRRRGFFRRRR